jgi:hypothetical protein
LKKRFEWRIAFVISAVLWGTSLLVITELLCVARWIFSRFRLRSAWAVVCAATNLYSRFALRRAAITSAEKTPRQSLYGTSLATTRLRRPSQWLAAGVAILVLGAGVTAIVAPPATGDAMIYQLSRATRWMSNHSVRFSPC